MGRLRAERSTAKRTSLVTTLWVTAITLPTSTLPYCTCSDSIRAGSKSRAANALRSITARPSGKSSLESEFRNKIHRRQQRPQRGRAAIEAARATAEYANHAEAGRDNFSISFPRGSRIPRFNSCDGHAPVSIFATREQIGLLQCKGAETQRVPDNCRLCVFATDLGLGRHTLKPPKPNIARPRDDFMAIPRDKTCGSRRRRSYRQSEQSARCWCNWSACSSSADRSTLRCGFANCHGSWA